MSANVVTCPNCQQKTLILWGYGESGLCDACVCSGDFSWHGKENHWIAFSPVKNSANRWVSDPRVSFLELREYIEACFRPWTVTKYSGYLVDNCAGVWGLLLLLKNKMERLEDDQEYRKALRKCKFLKKEEGDIQLKLNAAKINAGKIKGEILKKSPTQRRTLLDQQALLERELDRLHSRLGEIAKAFKQNDAIVNDLRMKHPSKIQTRCFERLCGEFERWKKGDIIREKMESIAHHVPWELLSHAKDWTSLVAIFERYGLRSNGYAEDLRRLKHLYDVLPYNNIYLGTASFAGYVVFECEPLKWAVLDCIQKGNALYVMNIENWKHLSQLSKGELLRLSGGGALRAIHSTMWEFNLEKMMYKRYKELSAKES